VLRWMPVSHNKAIGDAAPEQGALGDWGRLLIRAAWQESIPCPVKAR
jgi:hypothetical protein